MDTTLMIKTNKALRDDAKRVASELGVPLTTVVNAYLKQFVREKNFSLSIYPTPRPEKIAEWKKISKDADRGIGVEGPFASVEELFAHWDEARTRVKRKKTTARHKT